MLELSESTASRIFRDALKPPGWQKLNTRTKGRSKTKWRWQWLRYGSGLEVKAYKREAGEGSADEHHWISHSDFEKRTLEAMAPKFRAKLDLSVLTMEQPDYNDEVKPNMQVVSGRGRKAKAKSAPAPKKQSKNVNVPSGMKLTPVNFEEWRDWVEDDDFLIKYLLANRVQREVKDEEAKRRRKRKKKKLPTIPDQKFKSVRLSARQAMLRQQELAALAESGSDSSSSDSSSL